MKNVLVLGNGYDLAHGLKTSYGNFLDFIKEGNFETSAVPQTIKEEFEILCKNNTFINYLIDYTETLNTWVDFENELKDITYAVKRFFDNPIMESDRHYEINENDIPKYVLTVLEKLKFIPAAGTGTKHNKRPVEPMYFNPVYGVRWEKVKIHLREELDGLKRALVIYLKYYMPTLSNTSDFQIKQLAEIQPHYVFTFNYTKTYERYGIENDRSKVLHIHGDLDSENIVLGYDDEDSTDLALIQFKKYFQRIQYQLRRINKKVFLSPSEKAGEADIKDTVAHVYGMSLDKTDQDIILEIYQLAVKVVIYYRVSEDGSMSDYEKKVINMIAILGKDEFMTAIETERIVFEKIVNDKIDDD